MGGIIGALIVFGLALLGVGVAGSSFGLPISGLSALVMILAGIASLVVGAILATISRLYVRTGADVALVKTGLGGLKVIKDGGAVIVPMVHQVIRVPLRTFRLKVVRNGAEALLTQNKLRADVEAEFFIKVQPTDEQITAAARSMGDRTADENSLMQLLGDKLVSALRTVAARKTLEQLNAEREEFVEAVIQGVRADLEHNGFTLESVTISKLDQADTTQLNARNVFDAEGLLTITKIAEEKLTERNAIEQERKRERLQQDVEAQKKMLALQQQQAEAQADQSAKIAAARSAQERAEKEAEIAKDRAVAELDYKRQQAVEVAKQQAEQAAEVADQERQQAVEVAQRERQIAVADKERERAEAETKRLTAIKLQETESQAVETVKVEAAAERAKKQAIIGAEAEAETKLVVAQKAADAEAYKTKALADGKKAAADADAEAIRKKAGAEAEAAKLKSEGDKATALVPIEVQRQQVEITKQQAMIPVNVAAAQVTVDKDRVEQVLKPELEARDRSGKAAQEFELEQLRIKGQVEVQIAAAHAAGAFGGRVNMTLFGTAEDAAKMQAGLVRGAAFARTLDGFLGAANGNGGGSALKLLGAVAGHLGIDTSELLGNKDANGHSKPETPAQPS
ncbi:hypothetical protein HYV74_04290 [Candidatus Uhrbacteria bacterium]|nr:hypothetical protein [Candidatus Uhrbacteria bacterium]